MRENYTKTNLGGELDIDDLGVRCDDLDRIKRREKRYCPRRIPTPTAALPYTCTTVSSCGHITYAHGVTPKCSLESRGIHCDSRKISNPVMIHQTYQNQGLDTDDLQYASCTDACSPTCQCPTHDQGMIFLSYSMNESESDCHGNETRRYKAQEAHISRSEARTQRKRESSSGREEKKTTISTASRWGALPVIMSICRGRKSRNKLCTIQRSGFGRRNNFRIMQKRMMMLLFLVCVILPHSSIARGDTDYNDNVVKDAGVDDKNASASRLDNHERDPVHNVHKSQPTASKNYPMRNTNTNTAAAAQQARKRQEKNDEFLKWCKTALGIQTLLSIQEFEYVDHFHEWKVLNTHGSSYSSSSSSMPTPPSPKTFSMRGLAATRDISEGEVVISVPYHALISLHTTIDHDPVLSRILGPEGRRKYGWTLHKTRGKNRSQKRGSSSNGNDDNGDDEVMAGDTLYRLDGATIDTFHGHGGTMSYYEIALLIVALLYHASLGRLSPLAIYIDSLLDAPVDSMPYLWTEEKLQRKMGIVGEGGNGDDFRFALTSSSPSIWEVIKLVRGIQTDIREMYDDVMVVLMKEHPDIFGRPASSTEWAFSYEKFEWAFAMVNSRHWHLPLEDLDEVMVDLKRFKEVPDPAGSDHSQHNQDTESTTTVDAVNNMPATQPTDEYVSMHDEATKMEHIEEYIAPPVTTPSPAYLKSNNVNYDQDNVVSKHSFMAPLADMLNFGPPCTRGQYNPLTKAFEVVATCPFLKGQEVTFWYSDDCDNVIISNYGFTHPMVPRCPTIDDWKYRSQMWKEYAETLEKSLSETYEDLYDMLEELKDCHAKLDEKGGLSGGENRKEIGNGDGRKNGRPQFRRKEGRIDGKEKSKDNHGRIRKVKKRTNPNEREEIDL